VLLHHRLAFAEQEHVPLIGELALRLRARRRRASVPLLVDGGEVVMGSLAIAEHVDARGEQATLIPAALRAEVQALHERLEPVMATGRAQALRAVLGDDEVALFAAPPRLRALPGARAAARLGARFLLRKYDVSFAGITERLRAGLVEVRRALAGRPHVHPQFSYADVLCASLLQFVAPVSDRFVPLEPATRRSFSNPALAQEFADLVAWRDELYAQHRPVASS
jgi:glutathione S-transferase